MQCGGVSVLCSTVSVYNYVGCAVGCERAVDLQLHTGGHCQVLVQLVCGYTLSLATGDSAVAHMIGRLRIGQQVRFEGIATPTKGAKAPASPQ